MSLEEVLTLIFLCLLVFVDGASRRACCLRNGVSEECAQNLCEPMKPPGDVARYSLFDGRQNCTSYLTEISQCLTDGRDNMQCCEENAKDPEERSCFGLCSGEMSLFESYREMMSCLALNIPPIYECIVKGYKTIPTPPLNLKIENGLLRWDPSKENSHLVLRYKIYISFSSNGGTTELIRETMMTRFNISSLNIASQYAVFVIAESSEGRSQASEQLNMGGSSGTESSQVMTSTDSSHVFLSCTLRTHHERAHIDWEKKGPVDGWSRLEGIRFQRQSYRSSEDSLILSALRINHPKVSDEGLYRCLIRGHRAASVEVGLSVGNAQRVARSPMPLSPPETPSECCSRQMTRPNCISYCTSGSVHRRQIRPGAYLPYHNCTDEMHYLLQCTMTEARSGPCCIFKKIPHRCLGLCDRSYSMKSPFDAFTCMNFFNQILQCHEESLKILPSAISGLTLSTTNEVTLAEWKPAIGATAYSIYHKKKTSPQWKHIQTSATRVKLHSVEMIAILSSNEIGRSSPVRKIFENNGWISDYE